MSYDLVQRLRVIAAKPYTKVEWELAQEAADRIENLKNAIFVLATRIDDLETALRDIADEPEAAKYVLDVARRALKGK